MHLYMVSPLSDVTGATWGGSTVQSELDDADTTASTVSGHVLDTTQDSVEPTAIGKMLTNHLSNHSCVFGMCCWYM